jgi:hypothetical protein
MANATRQNFTKLQRDSAFDRNREWLQKSRVDGIEIALNYEHLRTQGKIIYCENCLFCHEDEAFFDVDHLVPDKKFLLWGKHAEARAPVNMIILCKSQVKGDLGCNQSKWMNDYVPPMRGLAWTRCLIDMNCYPIKSRPFIWT